MKRIYSILLLLSFFIGTIQPVMPMVEYAFNEGRLLELIQSINGESCTMATLQDISEECDCCDHSDSDAMLNIDYYPIPLEVTPLVVNHLIYTTQIALLITDENTITHHYSTPTPPPRLI